MLAIFERHHSLFGKESQVFDCIQTNMEVIVDPWSLKEPCRFVA
jgi:hypothetical protein